MDRKVLPPHVVPSHYDLEIVPNLESLNYRGKVEIDIEVMENCQWIQVNSHEITIESSFLSSPSLSSNLVSNGNTHNQTDQVTTINFAEEIQKGKYKLSIHFNGIINDQLVGFYRSEYTGRDGQKKYMATTQFEATYARRAFPCWDEPSRKATFKIKMIVPKELTALSNMDVEKEVVNEKVKEVTFQVTPIMSTYLVAFIVSDFDYIEQYTPEGVRMRVYTPPGLSEQGRFGLDVGVKTLSFLSKYFDESYPLPKMDFAAIPDFSFGAMENWGLVTYRTPYILYEEGKSSFRSKRDIANIVAHELAHQWFGNLVTMEWWTDLWLNEGFATWVAWMVIDHYFPEWECWTEFFIEEQTYGLGLDSLRSSHPIEVDLKNPDEIIQVFDAISYSKGACAIRMLVNFLGSDVFVNGLRSYLKKHKYGNAKTVDLWESLGEASGLPVAEMMHTWSRKTGFPLVQVEHSHDPNSYCFCQCRFLSSGDNTEEENKETWYVPLNVSEKSGGKINPLLLKNQKEEFTFSPDRNFLKVNQGQTGFYRVIYPPDELEKLKKSIQSKELAAIDRTGIISDCFAAAFSGKETVLTALNLLTSYRDDDSFAVWEEVSASLSHLRNVWAHQPQDVQDKLQKLIRDTFSHIVKRLGWKFSDSDSNSDGLLRSTAIMNAGSEGDQEVVAESKRLFKDLTSGKAESVHPNLFTAVCYISIAYGGEEEFNALIQLFKNTPVVDQKQKCLAAIGASQDEKLLIKALNFALGDEVKIQHIPMIYASVSSNILGREVAWKHLRDNWETVHKKLYETGHFLGRVVVRVCAGFSSEDKLKEVKDFFSKFPSNEVAAITRDIEKSYESIAINSKLLDRDSNGVKEWLQNNVK